MPQRRIAWVAWCLYTLVVGAGIARGGLWLDEMQVWCLARDSDGLSGLFHSIRNEGHPPLWPLLVKGLTMVFDHPAAMAVLHGLFAIATAGLILFRAPWPMAWRVLAVAGYFVLFEYAIIARNYGPGMFLLLAGVHCWQAQQRRSALLCMLLLPMMHLWGIVVALAFTGMLLVGSPKDRDVRRYAGAIALSALLALWIAMPADTLPYTPSLERVVLPDLPDKLAHLLGQVFIPFPDPTSPRPWNTDRLLDHAPMLHGLLGVLCFVAALRCISGRRSVLLFFVLAALGILAFPILAPFRSIRYVGPILLVLLACLWMAPPRTRGRSALVIILLALQVPGAIFMSLAAQRTPRSTAEDSVAFLQAGPYRDLPVMVHPFQIAPAVSGYLGRPVHCLATGQAESYCRWTHRPSRLEPDALLDALAHSPFPVAVLICDDPDLADRSSPALCIETLAHPGNAWIASEEHHIHLVSHP